ncbi:MAG: NifB/NifX family molybdenum-iron cluster-binding protein [Candidatus Pacebacteria bacterium]|nr:NifB/NifX family molybdenum-iron cluster-binding protein [Candidatus Paceibacterota bacterium]
MRIGIPSFGKTLESFVEPRFSWARYFVVLDERGNLEKVIENPATHIAKGADDLASQTIIENAIRILLLSDISPSAFKLLESAGVKVYQAERGLTIKEIFQLYKKGALQRLRSSPAIE